MSKFNLDTDFCRMCGFDGGLCNGCVKKKCYEQGRADEREKVLEEVDTIIDFIKNNSFDHSLEFDSFKAIGSSVMISILEQLKEQK